MEQPVTPDMPAEKGLFQKIAKSAGVVAFFTMCSRVAGLARDIVTFHYFGASAITDAFFIAFTIPNIFRRFVAEGALTVAFIPVYTEVRRKEGEQKAKAFYASVLGLLLISLVVLVIAGVLGAGFLVYALASGFSDNPEQMRLTVMLTRFMFPYVFFISLVALAMGVLNSHKHFAVPAASPVLLNIAMIGCTLLLYEYFSVPIYALAVGVVLGGVLQLLIQIPVLFRFKLLVKPSFDFSLKPVRKLLRIMFPALFGVGVYQLNLIILRQLGSYLPAGQITYYYNADRLMQLALGVFSIAIATAVLPSMSEQTAQGNKKELLGTWRFTTRLTNFITIPAAFGLAFIALPIVSTLYFHGAYSWLDVKWTSSAVIAFAPGLIAIGMFRSTVQVFYALEDLKTPVVVAGITVVVNLILGVLLLKYEVMGLALSLSLSSWFQLLLLIYLMKKRFGELLLNRVVGASIRQVFGTVVGSGFAVLFCSLGVWAEGPTLLNIAILFVSITLTVILYFAVTIMLGDQEAKMLKNAFMNRVWLRGK